MLRFGAVPDAGTPGSRLVVVRHGSTRWAREAKHTGRTDVPLDEEGRVQARALAGRLSGHRFAQVLCSPLGRARETCRLAGYAEGAEVVPHLAEWDYGEYEGLTVDQIRRTRPGWNLWDDGVPGGETLDQVADRADQVVEAARRSSGDTLAFAHGHVLRVVAARWLGWAAQMGRALLLAPAGLGVLSWEREIPVLGRWDDDGGDPLGSG